MPIGARIPAVGAGSYGIEKVFGANDKEAATAALTNAFFAAMGGGRGKAEQLDGKVVSVTGENGTAANVKVNIENGKLKLTEVAQGVRASFR